MYLQFLEANTAYPPDEEFEVGKANRDKNRYHNILPGEPNFQDIAKCLKICNRTMQSSNAMHNHCIVESWEVHHDLVTFSLTNQNATYTTSTQSFFTSLKVEGIIVCACDNQIS